MRLKEKTLLDIEYNLKGLRKINRYLLAGFIVFGVQHCLLYSFYPPYRPWCRDHDGLGFMNWSANHLDKALGLESPTADKADNSSDQGPK